MRHPTHLLELRLDRLYPVIDKLIAIIGQLTPPLIITARHPREGGANKLSVKQRRALLLQFLPHAAYVDVELRSALPLRAILDEARTRKIGRIISVHRLERMPSAGRLKVWARSAHDLDAEIFKVAVQTETADQMARLVAFFESEKRNISLAAMGVGRFGHRSRIELARRGSVLNYVHLGTAQIEGQLSQQEMQKYFPDQSSP